jgi:hypothetical protein
MQWYHSMSRIWSMTKQQHWLLNQGHQEWDPLLLFAARQLGQVPLEATHLN